MQKHLLLLLCWAVTLSCSYAEQPNKPQASNSSLKYRNPLPVAKDIADPHVIRVDGKYYLYATTHTHGYDVYTSLDLVNWTNAGSVFSGRRGAWAPDVFHDKKGNGKFYLCYTDDAEGDNRGHKRIGVAVSDKPTGPFEDKGMLVLDAIDAHLFRDDDGKYYLYYANIGGGFKMMVQPMADPLKKEGAPKLLFQPTEPWETKSGHVTEGPFVLKRQGVYYLTYSGTGADSPDYGIGYATARNPMGPFEKYSGNPVVKRSAKVFGPGHHCIVEGPKGDLWLVYHQKWQDDKSYKRFLAIDPIRFDENGVLRATATRDSDQLAP